MYELESSAHLVAHSTQKQFIRPSAHQIVSNDAEIAREWRTTLAAADTALTVLRAATAHRDADPTISDRPAVTAPITAIRDWVLEIRRVIARALPLIITAAGHRDSPTVLAAQLADATESITALHDMNRHSDQRGSNSWALPSATDEIVPVWTSRRAWLAQVEYAVTSADGRALCSKQEIDPQVVCRHAAVYAGFAQGNTGRGVTASHETIQAATGKSRTTNKRSRRILVALKLVHVAATGRTLRTPEYLAATLHHGSSQSRAASTIHLTTPAHLAHIDAAPIKRKRRVTAAQKPGPLSSVALSRRESSYKKNSPNVRKRNSGEQKKSTKIRKDAKPLHLQRAAAELLNRIPALRRVGHMGSICQVIASAGIDTTVWTGRDIANALDRDSQRRGWMWPAAITDPCAFIAWRIRGLSWTGLSPSAAAKRTSEHLRAARKAADLAQEQAEANRASDATRKQRMAEIAALLAPASPTLATNATKPVARVEAPTRPDTAAARTAARTAARAELAALRRSPAALRHSPAAA